MLVRTAVAALRLALSLPGSTLLVDGKPLVENGVLKVTPAVASK